MPAILLIAASAGLFSPASSMGVFSPAAAQESCVSGKQGTRAVKAGQILPFPTAAQRAGVSSRDVQHVALCRAGGGFVYRVTIVQAGGAPRVISIPAN